MIKLEKWKKNILETIVDENNNKNNLFFTSEDRNNQIVSQDNKNDNFTKFLKQKMNNNKHIKREPYINKNFETEGDIFNENIGRNKKDNELEINQNDIVFDNVKNISNNNNQIDLGKTNSSRYNMQ